MILDHDVSKIKVCSVQKARIWRVSSDLVMPFHILTLNVSQSKKQLSEDGAEYVNGFSSPNENAVALILPA